MNVKSGGILICVWGNRRGLIESTIRETMQELSAERAELIIID